MLADFEPAKSCSYVFTQERYKVCEHFQNIWMAYFDDVYEYKKYELGGISSMNFLHYLQIFESGKFSQFSYGFNTNVLTYN